MQQQQQQQQQEQRYEEGMNELVEFAVKATNNLQLP